MSIVRHIHGIPLGGDVLQLAGFYQFTEDATGGGLHLHALKLEVATGEDGVLREVFRQLLVNFLLGHRLGVWLVFRTLYFLFLEALFQVGIGTEGHGFELDVFRTDGMDGAHFFLAMKVHLKVADAFQIDFSTLAEVFRHLVGQGDEDGLHIGHGER